MTTLIGSLVTRLLWAGKNMRLWRPRENRQAGVRDGERCVNGQVALSLLALFWDNRKNKERGVTDNWRQTATVHPCLDYNLMDYSRFDYLWLDYNVWTIAIWTTYDVWTIAVWTILDYKDVQTTRTFGLLPFGLSPFGLFWTTGTFGLQGHLDYRHLDY